MEKKKFECFGSVFGRRVCSFLSLQKVRWLFCQRKSKFLFRISVFVVEVMRGGIDCAKPSDVRCCFSTIFFFCLIFYPHFFVDVIVLCAFNKFDRKSWAQTENDVPNQMEMDKEKYDGNRNKNDLSIIETASIPAKYQQKKKICSVVRYIHYAWKNFMICYCLLAMFFCSFDFSLQWSVMANNNEKESEVKKNLIFPSVETHLNTQKKNRQKDETLLSLFCRILNSKVNNFHRTGLNFLRVKCGFFAHVHFTAISFSRAFQTPDF